MGMFIEVDYEHLPVCQMYFLGHSGHVNCDIPLWLWSWEYWKYGMKLVGKHRLIYWHFSAGVLCN